MSPNESNAIAELTAEVRSLSGKIDVLHTKLFGDDKQETKQGRIPRLEASVESHGRRFKRIEPIALALRAAGALIFGAGGYLLNHFLPMKGH